MDLVFVVAVVGLLVLGAILAGRNDFRRHRIGRTGVLTKATITEVQTAALDGGPLFVAKYRYVDSSGVEHLGSTPFLNYDPTLRSSGNQCEIRFDPSHPERSLWIEGNT